MNEWWWLSLEYLLNVSVQARPSVSLLKWLVGSRVTTLSEVLGVGTA